MREGGGICGRMKDRMKTRGRGGQWCDKEEEGGEIGLKEPDVSAEPLFSGSQSSVYGRARGLRPPAS